MTDIFTDQFQDHNIKYPVRVVWNIVLSGIALE